MNHAPRPEWPLIVALGCAAAIFLPVYAQSPTAGAKPVTVAEYRTYAMTHDGDASHGQALFADAARAACTKCHTLDGKGGHAGPDLAAVGDQFARGELIDSILSPSARIAVGYATTTVQTKSGDTVLGVLKQSTDAWIELAGADGQRTRIATADIVDQRGSNTSLMPEGLQWLFSPQDFTDLIQYLAGLRLPDNAMASHRGMPDVIPPLAHPVAVHPVLETPLTVPVGTNKVKTGLVWLGQIPGHPDSFLAAHQAGKIWRVKIDENGARSSVFADFVDETFSARGPNGLLGLAFHPHFPENRKFYVKHQVLEDGKITTRLDEHTMTPDLMQDSGNAPRLILKIQAVAEHHNGGCIQFGPDGFLYLGMGDSAPNFDPQGYAQDLHRLFGKMLRIDVDHRDPGLEYAIPADNPFRNRSDARPEIWAYGLREPWRFSFDSLNGELWVADLGQERGDEVDIVRRGENLGWNIFEGFELFGNGHRPEGKDYVPPIFAGRRKHGNAIMGGFVYRSNPKSSFYGVYLFGDYQSKRLWGLTQSDRTLRTIREIGTVPQSITCFASDEAGRVYVVGYEGMIYRLDLESAVFETQ
jgi:putative heme-binding domain-containing protein